MLWPQGEENVQLQALKQLGGDLIQGYFIAWPMDASGINAFIVESKKTLVLKA